MVGNKIVREALIEAFWRIGKKLKQVPEDIPVPPVSSLKDLETYLLYRFENERLNGLSVPLTGWEFAYVQTGDKEVASFSPKIGDPLYLQIEVKTWKRINGGQVAEIDMWSVWKKECILRITMMYDSFHEAFVPEDCYVLDGLDPRQKWPRRVLQFFGDILLSLPKDVDDHTAIDRLNIHRAKKSREVFLLLLSVGKGNKKIPRKKAERKGENNG